MGKDELNQSLSAAILCHRISKRKHFSNENYHVALICFVCFIISQPSLALLHSGGTHLCLSFPLKSSSNASLRQNQFYIGQSTELFSSIGRDDIQQISSATNELLSMRNSVMNGLKNNDFHSATATIEEMIDMAIGKQEVDRVVDDAIQAFTTLAFSTPHRGYKARKRILMGMKIVNKQLSSQMADPLQSVPKKTFKDALRALTSLHEFDRQQQQKYLITDSAFRVLQRLVTGVGIRQSQQGRGQKISSSKITKNQIREQEFNMVLNAYSNLGKMDMAHRVVALQERTEHAPPLSPVAYSILLKGYGRLGDLANVKMILRHAEMNGIEPDTIMINSLIDAYINCNAMHKAREIFDIMKKPSEENICNSKYSNLIEIDTCPKPNRRTYNTIMKGLANKGKLDESFSLARDMEMKGMYDDVTTNTLVHAAVVSGNFTLAEILLEKHTAMISSGDGRRTQRHPNIEAYTEVVDGYAKSGELNKAIDFFRVMKKRGVEPNEVTFTCLIAGFAREGEITRAWKMIGFMREKELRPTSITYNAFISALTSNVADSPDILRIDNLIPLFDDNIDEAFQVLKAMLSAGIRPNTITVSMLVSALGRSTPSRVEEAKSLLTKLKREGLDFSQNNKVITALVQAYGRDGDLTGALDVFRNLKRPDTVAVNAFLDACCRCNKENIAIDTFKHYFDTKIASASISSAVSVRLDPDVVTYSVLVSALIKRASIESSIIAQKLYTEMAEKKIRIDKTMVDISLKAIIRKGGSFNNYDVKLAIRILSDAEKLGDWEEGQLERRKRAFRAVVAGQMRFDKDLREMLPPAIYDDDDKLFQRKGWNKVDSGFRLWGGGRMELPPEEDKFLESKGWNNVDSGFRII